MFKLVKTCQHLELRPKEEDRSEVNASILEYQQKDTTPDEKEEYMDFLIGKGKMAGRYYEPHCKKNDCPCVVLESCVISQQYGGLGHFYQPLNFTINNSKMDKCPDRQLPETNKPGMEYLDIFMITHIQK